MKLQQQQINQLADWLDKAEAKIDKSNEIGADIDAVRKQVDNHKVQAIDDDDKDCDDDNDNDDNDKKNYDNDGWQ